MKNKYLLPLFGAALLLGGCKKFVEEVYINPNNPTVVVPEAVMPPMIANMARGVNFDARMTGAFTGYWGRVGSFDSWDRHGYVPGSDAGGEKWRTHYWNLGQNLINGIRDANAQGKPELSGSYYAMFAWSWMLLADYHGDVILKQAFDASRLTFDYETQDQVYEHCFKLMDSANYFLDKALADPAAAGRLATPDFYFLKGNLSQWKKFNYGNKARLFHRYYNKATYKADSVIKYVDLSLANASEDCMISYDAATLFSDRLNFFAPFRANMGTFRPGQLMIDYLRGKFNGNVVDPRLAYMFLASIDGVVRGVVPSSGESTSLPFAQRMPNLWGVMPTSAVPAPTAAPTTDANARTYFKNASRTPVLTYTELQFLKSEAAFKKGDKATALQAYKNGVNGSFDMLINNFTGYVPITPVARQSFIDNPNIVPPSSDGLTLQNIMSQKYVALWGHGWEETYTDMRRHNWDTVNVYKGFALTNYYPDNGAKFSNRVRPRYNSEYLWNVESLRKINGGMPPTGIDINYHTLEVWFQKP